MSRSPLLLAVETATALASVALMRGEQVLARRSVRSRGHHAETLLPMLDALLADAGTGLGDVEAFAVSIGPGGFTGLRVGLATVKGLAFEGSRPVVPVSTLEALALAALRSGRGEPGGLLVPALDARRGELYAAALRVGAAHAVLEPVLEEAVYTPEALAAALPQAGLVVGEGASIVARTPGGEPHPKLSPEASPVTLPDAEAVGLLASRALARGEGAAAAALVPRYLRRAQAEVVRGRL